MLTTKILDKVEIERQYNVEYQPRSRLSEIQKFVKKMNPKVLQCPYQIYIQKNITTILLSCINIRHLKILNEKKNKLHIKMTYILVQLA